MTDRLREAIQSRLSKGGTGRRFHPNADGITVACSGCQRCNGTATRVVADKPALGTVRQVNALRNRRAAADAASREALANAAKIRPGRAATEDRDVSGIPLAMRYRLGINPSVPMPDVTTTEVLKRTAAKGTMPWEFVGARCQSIKQDEIWARRWSKNGQTTTQTGRIRGNPNSLLGPARLGDLANLMVEPYTAGGGLDGNDD